MFENKFTDAEQTKKEDNTNINEDIKHKFDIVFGEEEETREYRKKNPEESYVIMNAVLFDLDEIELETKKKIVCEHILDEMSVVDKINVMNDAYKEEEMSEQMIIIKNICELNKFSFKDTYAVMLVHDTNNIADVLVVLEDNAWKRGTLSDIKHFKRTSLSMVSALEEKLDSQENIVGHIEMKNTKYEMKIKDLTDDRSNGFRCLTTPHRRLNKILGDILTVWWNGDRVTELLGRKRKPSEICVLLELVLRYFNNEGIDDKVWFLNRMSVMSMKTYNIKLNGKKKI
tara:strand:- start:1532 stop:2389 length:858 start_codon:yes stop_codon:yes gene_type:complete